MKSSDNSFPYPIRWGIIGLGKIAQKFAQDLSLVPNSKLVAVASRNIDKAKSFADQYGAQHAFGDYQSLVAFEEVDVVYIATPHQRHCQDTLMALEHGKAVLCEKPLGLKIEEVEKMIAFSKGSRVFFMEAMWTRFFPLVDKAKSIIDNGTLGNLRTLRADFGFHADFEPSGRVFNKELGGGSLMDVGIYPLFISLLLLGYPERVEAQATKLENGIDESCYILLHYPKGIKAQLYSSIVAKTEVEATIFGESGLLKLHGRFHHPKKLTWGRYYEDEKEVVDEYKGFGYCYEIAHVNECLHRGLTESPIMNHQLSLQLFRLLEAVKKEIGLVY